MAIKLPDTLRTANDTYAIAVSEEIKGGIRGVQTVEDLSRINNALISNGMLVWVEKSKSYYKYTNGTWSILSASASGTPLLTTAQITALKNQGVLPDNYIWIRSKDDIDLEQEGVVNKTYTTSKNGSYVDILFQAIRQLQTEVAKMRNTFKYGMYSCTNKEMAVSNVVNEMVATPADEPLWAIEEDGLSYVYALDFKDGYNKDDASKTTFNIISEINGLIQNVNGTYYDISSTNKQKVYFTHKNTEPIDEEDIEDINIYKDDKGNLPEYVSTLEGMSDPKQFIYMTITNKKDKGKSYLLDFSVLIEPKRDVSISLDAQRSPIDNINFTNLMPNYVETVNVMLLLNRKMVKETTEGDKKTYTWYGNNYLYVSISDYYTNDVIIEGYYNKTDGKLYKNIQDLGDQYYFSKVYFGMLKLNKFNVYSRYQDFTKFIGETDKVVKPNIPNDSDYRYKVAHITIRSVSDEAELREIKQYLPNNELIWEEKNSVLWIKSNDKVVQIGGTSNSNNNGNQNNNKDSMTQEELIKALKEMGIVYDSNNGLELEQAKVEDITFINSNLSDKYVYSIDSEGNLHSTIVPKVLLESRVANKNLYETSKPGSTFTPRGFVANLVCGEKNEQLGIDNNLSASTTGSILNESDRIHISQFYAPLSTDIAEGKIGCSHAFIELTNTSTFDFQLDGCYLHFFSLSDTGVTTYYNLPLKGVIPAGNTFLIRGKKYADYKNSNVFIKVSTFDMEWFSEKNELIDLTVNTTYNGYALALTYGNTVVDNGVETEISPVTTLAKIDVDNSYKYRDNYIDGIIYSFKVANIPNTYRTWAIFNSGYNVLSNSLFRETFLLDPAKQGFQALCSNTKDSSRARHEKNTDFTLLSLANEFIEFPKSDSVKAVSDYSPRASFEHKTVITEKSNIDLNKPNMITCAFGINMLTTRCFNWISGGIFDEFIWVRKKGSNTAWKDCARYESYTSSKCSVVTERSTSEITKKTFNESDTAQKEAKTYIYDRITGIFPGTTTQYTAHKVIINLPTPSSGTSEYEYCVGRALLDGSPDPAHSNVNELYTFTMYSSAYVPRIYQTSDQQGFHWIEYQVWAGAAKKLNEYIDSTKGTQYMPVLVNTGDMTQSGSRISEWFDYYEAGKCLFNHLEQMNVVGNNDLANIDPTLLGNGDDSGKSNSFYFHVFYCYEVDNFGNTAYPIVNKKYIPSLYYFGTNDYRFIMINSEITTKCCSDWFGISNYNIYTGYTIGATGNTYKTDNTWTPIYDRLFAIMNSFTGKQFITAVHEMPFTVITKANIKYDTKIIAAQRSASGTSLVGSHMNSITAEDTGYGFNWFSRLLEYFASKRKTKLCIGGHKHTYAMTFPIRENYTYTNNGVSVDSKTTPMPMSATLNNAIEKSVKWTKKYTYNAETCTFTESTSGTNVVNTSKLPYIPTDVKSMTYKGSTSIAQAAKAANGFLPYQYLNTLNTTNAITYLMCQATGYKYSSNKELPAYTQAFSELIPQTTEAEKPANTQKFPMFIDIVLNNTNISYKLISVANVFDSAYLFTPLTYGKADSELKYMKINAGTLYGSWQSNSTNLKTL